MEPLERNKIRQLKKELDHVKKALIKWNSLMMKREELEVKIEQKRLENDMDPELKLLKKHLRELDTLLDHLEEHSPDKMAQLEEKLIASILLDPSLRKEYEEIIYSLEQTKQKSKSLDRIYQILAHLHALLKEVLEARQMIRKRGILSYIFGANPNQIISQHLHAIDEQIHLILPLIDDPKLDTFLQNLQKESRLRWGFKKIDTVFEEAYVLLEQTLMHFQQELKTNDEQLEEIELLRQNWISDKSQ